MKIYIGSDHAGFEMKASLTAYLSGLGHEVRDLGPKRFEREDDYPDTIAPVAREVAADPKGSVGIILGYSGTGEAIIANRFRGVRAANFYGGTMEIIRLSREHNDANILSLGAGFLSDELAKQAAKLWLDTKFSGQERHARRIEKIDHAAEIGQTPLL